MGLLESALNFIPQTLDSILNFTNENLASALNFTEDKVSNYFQPNPNKVRVRDVLREGQDILSRPFQPTQEDIDYASQNMGMTKWGQLLVKNPLSKSGYTFVEPLAGALGMKDVVKEGLDAIGGQLLKNIKGEAKPVFQGLGSSIKGGMDFVKSLFKDLERKPIFNNPLYHDAPRGTKVLDGIILDGNNLEKHSDDIRQKLSSIGYKDVNENVNLSLMDEENPLVKNGIEIVFENPNGKALNVYMRTDGKKTVMTFDETAMDTGGKFHTNNNYVPKFVKDLYSPTKIKSSLPVYQGETDL